VGFKLEELLVHKPGVLFQQDRCKTGKTVYRTKAEARAAVGPINREQLTRMVVFRCSWCPGYHLGHRRGAMR
jgi:hypothetical protein